MAPGADDMIRRFIPDLDKLALIGEVDVPVAANWKVIQENSIEGYHFDYSGYELRPHGEWWSHIGPPRTGATHAYGVPLAGARWQTDWFFNSGRWPDVTIYVFPYADAVGTFIMNLTGPESSSLRFAYCAPAGRDLPEVTRACIRWMNEDLGPEDIRLNISNQKGLRSQGFEHGIYMIGEGLGSRSEILVRHFHRLCHDAARTWRRAPGCWSTGSCSTGGRRPVPNFPAAARS